MNLELLRPIIKHFCFTLNTKRFVTLLTNGKTTLKQAYFPFGLKCPHNNTLNMHFCVKTDL